MRVVILLKEGKRAGPARPAVFDITCVCEAVQWVRNKELPPNKAALLLPGGDLNVMLQSSGVYFFVWANLPGKQWLLHSGTSDCYNELSKKHNHQGKIF